MAELPCIVGDARGNIYRIKAKTEFDRWAMTYDRSVLNYFMFRPAYRVMLREVRDWWWRSRVRTMSLLDVGAGTGTFLEWLHRSEVPLRGQGLDYSPEMCAVARKKALQRGYAGNVEFAEGDSEQMPFGDASFDIVTCANSFHHYPNQQRVIEQMRRVLRPGGRLILVDGFRDRLLGWIFFDLIVERVERAVHHAAQVELHDMIRESGFASVRQFTFNPVPPLLATVADL